MPKLAILGGNKVRETPFKPAQVIQAEEIVAMTRFLCQDNPILSGYRGNSGPAFWGGEQVQALEGELQSYIGFHHHIAVVNSCTSALQIACGTIGLEPGDEVIVTPWSMTCSATAPLLYGAIPVFADIEPDYFCLDPKSIEEKITSKTKAIIVVDLFGQPFDVEAMDRIARKYNIWIIEDAAQALGAEYHDDKTGTLGNIGCLSFTWGKHITCGEGGALVVQNNNKFNKCAALRNHIEAVTNGMDNIDLLSYSGVSMAGFNMRLTELQAVILREQLKRYKESDFIFSEIKFLTQKIEKNIPCIKASTTRNNCTHVKFLQAFYYNEKLADGIPRNKFIDAVKAELPNNGYGLNNGYITPIYQMPVFRNSLHWTLKEQDYEFVKCPVVERLQEKEIFTTSFHRMDLTMEDLYDITEAFIKVWENKEELR